MYGEETDLCLRARKAGARPMITPKATIVHYGGGSTNGHADKIVRISAAHISVMDKHFSSVGRVIGRRAIIGGVALRATAFGLAGALAPKRYASQAAAWRDAWSRRAEWIKGFA
jgi:GT2 family glycosyltransferase